LRPLPLGKRKNRLARLPARAQPGIALNQHTDENGRSVPDKPGGAAGAPEAAKHLAQSGRNLCRQSDSTAGGTEWHDKMVHAMGIE
jgi:hypothetical protein